MAYLPLCHEDGRGEAVHLMTSTIPPFRIYPTKQGFRTGIHPHLLQFAQTRGLFNEHAAVNACNHNQAPRLPRAHHLLLF